MENLDKAALQYLAGLKKTIQECGIPMSAPHSPASVNITAGSGQELASMLKDIMNLAGVHKDHAASTEVLPGNEPTDQLQNTTMQHPSMHELIKVVDMPQEEMIQDSMNDDQRMYDNSPDEEGKAAGNWPLDGDQDNNLSAAKDVVVDRNKVTTAESLMAEYKKFISEQYDFSTISPQQRRALIQIVNKWKNTPGSHEATMLGGIWHAWCDSGIMTDGFSRNDARRVAAAGLEEFSYEHDLGEINYAVKNQDHGDDLDCVKASNELQLITDDNTDMETLCAYMKQNLLGESKSFKKKVDEGRDVFGDEEDYYDDVEDDDDFYDDEDDGDDGFNYRRFAQPGSALHAADDNNPRIFPCPTCKHPNRLTKLDKMKGYQCDSCANATERGTEINYYDNDIDNDDDIREENSNPTNTIFINCGPHGVRGAAVETTHDMITSLRDTLLSAIQNKEITKNEIRSMHSQLAAELTKIFPEILKTGRAYSDILGNYDKETFDADLVHLAVYDHVGNGKQIVIKPSGPASSSVN